MVTKTVISYRIQAKQSLGCVQCCRSRTGRIWDLIKNDDLAIEKCIITFSRTVGLIRNKNNKITLKLKGSGSGFFKDRDPDKKRSGSATLNWFDTLKWDWGTNLTSPQSWMVRRSIEGGEGERG